MPMRGELPPVSTRDYAQRPSIIDNARSRIAAIVGNADLQAIVLFSAIGILMSFNVMLRFPDFGQQVATLAVFP